MIHQCSWYENKFTVLRQLLYCDVVRRLTATVTEFPMVLGSFRKLVLPSNALFPSVVHVPLR